MTRRCAVIGDPAAHSLSPAIHRAGYAACGLDWDYGAFDVPAAGLDTFVSRCAADPEWVGLSVTAPHKQAILTHGEPDAVARLVGGGNTLVFGEEPRVYNTDVPGFVRAWRAHGGGRVGSAAIVGNGATARSLLVALAGLELREAVVLARDPQRASGLVGLGEALGVGMAAVPLDEPVGGLDLIASTVPGEATSPHAAAWAQGAAVVFDAVYDPWPTPLGLAAERLGRKALNGLDLLAGQAVDQFARFTGREVTFGQCRHAAEAELRRRSLTQ
ncbi:MAG: shikimate dehydrogenase [Propionibacteriaceae bacterium]|nr:shikimate dehydrogenase [Propionibacteriaceae bacterium]